MRRVALSIFAFALLCASSTSLRADPVYVGGPDLDVHSWQSGWFQDNASGSFDHVQFQIDTGSTTGFHQTDASHPSTTFEVPSGSLMFPGGAVQSIDLTSLVAKISGGGDSPFKFDLVFYDPKPTFVGVSYQLFNGSKLVEDGYFYKPDGDTASSVPGGQSVGNGWCYSASPATVGVSEPTGVAALSSLAGVGLIGLLWRRRP